MVSVGLLTIRDVLARLCVDLHAISDDFVTVSELRAAFVNDFEGNPKGRRAIWRWFHAILRGIQTRNREKNAVRNFGRR